MDIQDFEKENRFLKGLLTRDQNTLDILIQSIHDLTRLLDKSRRDYDELKQKYEELLVKPDICMAEEKSSSAEKTGKQK